MVDRFAGVPDLSLLTPMSNAAEVTPSDDKDLDYATRQIYIGRGGDLTVTLLKGQTVTYYNVPTGITMRIRVSKVWALGTNCGNIVAEW